MIFVSTRGSTDKVFVCGILPLRGITGSCVGTFSCEQMEVMDVMDGSVGCTGCNGYSMQGLRSIYPD